MADVEQALIDQADTLTDEVREALRAQRRRRVQTEAARRARHLVNQQVTRSYNQERAAEGNHHKVLVVPTHFGGKRARSHARYIARHKNG